MSLSLQTTLADDMHLAGGQLLLVEQTLNKEKSLIYQAGTKRPTVSKRRGQDSESGELEKGTVHQGDTSSCLRCATVEKETIKTRDCKLLLDAFQFVGISRQQNSKQQRYIQA
jgi:hypothetical protein